jgi:hypothetical protein
MFHHVITTWPEPWHELESRPQDQLNECVRGILQFLHANLEPVDIVVSLNSYFGGPSFESRLEYRLYCRQLLGSLLFLQAGDKFGLHQATTDSFSTFLII